MIDSLFILMNPFMSCISNLKCIEIINKKNMLINKKNKNCLSQLDIVDKIT